MVRSKRTGTCLNPGQANKPVKETLRSGSPDKASTYCRVMRLMAHLLAAGLTSDNLLKMFQNARPDQRWNRVPCDLSCTPKTTSTSSCCMTSKKRPSSSGGSSRSESSKKIRLTVGCARRASIDQEKRKIGGDLFGRCHTPCY